MVNELKERLLLWKDFELPELIEREIRIPETKDIIAIIGPRRAGKTYFMFQIMKKLLQEKNIEKENILYINFDDIVFRKYDLRKILEVYYELFNPKGKIFLFLDEVQNLNNWNIWLRSLHDMNYKIFVTGSSSKLLLKEIAKELRGRYISKIILPFSFKEFLKAKDFKFEETFERIGKLKNLLSEYLRFGGFPEVVLIENRIDKIEKLNSIFETTFYRDFVERFRIREIEVAREMLEFILSNVSQPFSITKIHKTFKSFGINASKRTLWKYYNQMLSSLLFLESKVFTYSKRKELVLPKKLYSVDTGIASLLKEQKESFLIENLVAIKLAGKGYELNYYLTKSREEIDFYVREKRTLIEVTYDYDEKHKNKLRKAMDELRVKEGIVITWDYESEESVKGKKIKFLPLWKWLLAENV